MTQTNASPRFTAREWNASGATQFYGKDRKRSYIVEVSLSENVQGDLLLPYESYLNPVVELPREQS